MAVGLRQMKGEIMRRTVLAAAISAGAFVCVLSSAEAGMLIPVPQVPGSQGTDVYSINTNNVLTGDYQDQNYREHGFVGTLDGNYTFFDLGRSQLTQGRYINDDGVVTGWAAQGGESPLEHRFERATDGTITRLTLNGKRLRGSGRPGSITNNNHLAGQYEEQRLNGSFTRPRS